MVILTRPILKHFEVFIFQDLLTGLWFVDEITIQLIFCAAEEADLLAGFHNGAAEHGLALSHRPSFVVKGALHFIEATVHSVASLAQLQALLDHGDWICTSIEAFTSPVFISSQDSLPFFALIIGSNLFLSESYQCWFHRMIHFDLLIILSLVINFSVQVIDFDLLLIIELVTLEDVFF